MDTGHHRLRGATGSVVLASRRHGGGSVTETRLDPVEAALGKASEDRVRLAEAPAHLDPGRVG